MRRLGLSLVEIGRRQEGMALLEMAVEKNRSPENLISLAQCLAFLGEAGRGPRQDMERALSLARSAARANTEDDPSYWTIVVQLSLEMEKEQDFREATGMLLKQYPDTMVTRYFSAVVAATDGDWIKAEEEIKKAQALGLPEEAANEFLSSGVHTRATVWRYTYYSLYLVAAWALGLAVLFVLGKVFSKMTLRWIETADPNVEIGGWLEASWETEIPAGRPPRHRYRLTEAGLEQAKQLADAKVQTERAKRVRLRPRTEGA